MFPTFHTLTDLGAWYRQHHCQTDCTARLAESVVGTSPFTSYRLRDKGQASSDGHTTQGQGGPMKANLKRRGQLISCALAALLGVNSCIAGVG